MSQAAITEDQLQALRDEQDVIARQITAAKRLLKTKRARDEVLEFAQLLHPHPKDPENTDVSRYLIGPLHKALGRALHEIEEGKHRRLIITVPPRHGKTQLVSKIFPAWFIGRDPYRSVITATYNDVFAEDFGRAVRHYMKSPAYAQVFPNAKLRQGSAAADRLETEFGGNLFFVGVKGTLTGRGGDLLIVDDPIKGSEDAQSAAMRDKLWDWFNNDLMSRQMTDEGIVLLIMTRWHEDDIVGRLTDPTNPHYNKDEAAEWEIINLPALAEENDALGRPVGAPLWPERFGVKYLESQRRRDPVKFSALYQQRPTPADGDFFRAEHWRDYGPEDLPLEMRYYISVDLAVAQKQHNDPSVVLVGGVDSRDRLYLIDCVWKRMPTDVSTDIIMDRIKRWKPMRVWGEKDHIFKSVGPFLRKRMREEKVYADIQEIASYADKQKKAQPIQGRMAMGMVFFPRGAEWAIRAKEEMLKFPRGSHDDFVDALATMGRGLDEMVAPSVPEDAEVVIKPGTMRWFKEQRRMSEGYSFAKSGW